MSLPTWCRKCNAILSTAEAATYHSFCEDCWVAPFPTSDHRGGIVKAGSVVKPRLDGRVVRADTNLGAGRE